jgi:hypothetical protein
MALSYLTMADSSQTDSDLIIRNACAELGSDTWMALISVSGCPQDLMRVQATSDVSDISDRWRAISAYLFQSLNTDEVHKRDMMRDLSEHTQK